MLERLKAQFYSFLLELGYNATDIGEYEENFPWLMLRTNGYQVLDSFNTRMSSATLVLDIFSQYPGEKEIINIVENIGSKINNLKESNPDILYCYQKTLKILDDKSTGPVRKHGVVVYEFLMGQGFAESEESNDDELEN